MNNFLNIFSCLDEYKLQHLYSEHKKPNVILTDNQKFALCIRYDWKTMKAPIMEIKGKYSYAQKIIKAGKLNDIMIVNKPSLA